MSKSIVTNYEKCCLICASPNTERHHLLMGNKHRHLAEEDGLVCGLCPAHHNSSNMSVHMNKEMKILSQQLAQACWERKYLAEKLANANHDGLNEQSVEDWFDEAREAFRKRYGESFL